MSMSPRWRRPLLAVFALAQPGWLAFLLLTVTLLGLTVGSNALVQTMVVESVAPQDAGAASGYFLCVISLGNRTGYILFGAIVDNSRRYAVAWLLLGAMGAVSRVIIVLGFADQRQWKDRSVASEPIR